MHLILIILLILACLGPAAVLRAAADCGCIRRASTIQVAAEGLGCSLRPMGRGTRACLYTAAIRRALTE
jgi:hypothetical protein